MFFLILEDLVFTLTNLFFKLTITYFTTFSRTLNMADKLSWTTKYVRSTNTEQVSLNKDQVLSNSFLNKESFFYFYLNFES